MNFSEEVYYSLTGNLIEPVAGVEGAFAEMSAPFGVEITINEDGIGIVKLN